MGTDSHESSDEDPDDQEVRKTMEDVDHTHPDTDETFTDTGVYDRGKTGTDDDPEDDDADEP